MAASDKRFIGALAVISRLEIVRIQNLGEVRGDFSTPMVFKMKSLNTIKVHFKISPTHTFEYNVQSSPSSFWRSQWPFKSGGMLNCHGKTVLNTTSLMDQIANYTIPKGGDSRKVLLCVLGIL